MKTTKNELAILTYLSDNKNYVVAMGVDELKYAIDGFTENQTKGVVGSLVKKGLVTTDKVNGQDEVVYISEVGEEIVAQNKIQHQKFRVFEFDRNEKLENEFNIDAPEIDNVIDYLKDELLSDFMEKGFKAKEIDIHKGTHHSSLTSHSVQLFAQAFQEDGDDWKSDSGHRNFVIVKIS